MTVVHIISSPVYITNTQHDYNKNTRNLRPVIPLFFMVEFFEERFKKWKQLERELM